MKTIRAGKLCFEMDDQAKRARFFSPGLMDSHAAEALWQMKVSCAGEELNLVSSDQQGVVEGKTDELVVRYPTLMDAFGNEHLIELTMVFSIQNGALAVRGEVVNHTEDETVLQLTAPMVYADSLRGSKEQDVLYLPLGLGIRIKNPWLLKRKMDTILNPFFYQRIGTAFVYQCAYPGCSMAWMGVESGVGFLYVGQHDPQARNCYLCAGHTIPEKNNRLLLCVVRELSLQPGLSAVIPVTCTAVLEGGYRVGAELYRDFAREAFLNGRGKWKNLPCATELRQVSVKGRYDRLLEWYEESGADGLILFEWWDRQLNEETAEPVLKEENRRALEEGIRRIQGKGGRVILGVHDLYPEKYGVLNEEGKGNLACVDENGKEYLAEYDMSPHSTWQVQRRAYITACPYHPVWRGRVKAVMDQVSALKPDAILARALGTPAGSFCVSRAHSHAGALDWHAGMAGLYRELPGDVLYDTSMAYDGAAAYAGCLLSLDPLLAETDSFPRMFADAFPDVPVYVPKSLSDGNTFVLLS